MASATGFARTQVQSVTTCSQVAPPSREISESRGVPRRVIRCDECGSSCMAICSVDLRFFCMNHFVGYCYQRLAEYESASARGGIVEPKRKFLREAALQATKLLLIGHQLQNMERARLFDIVLWSNELFYRSMATFHYGCDAAVLRNR